MTPYDQPGTAPSPAPSAPPESQPQASAAPAAPAPAAPAADPDSAPPAAAPTAEERERIKADGEEIELTRDQMRQYASMGINYTRKTQTLAEEKKALQAEREAIARERQEMARLYGTNQRPANAQEPPKPALPELDPELAAAMEARLAPHQEKLKQIETALAGETARRSYLHKKTVISEAVNEAVKLFPDSDKFTVLNLAANHLQDDDDDDVIRATILEAARIDSTRVQKIGHRAVDGAITQKNQAPAAAAGRPAGQPVHVPDVSSLESTMMEARRALGVT